MARVYELVVIKPDGTETVAPESNHLTQIISEAMFPPFRDGKLPDRIGSALGAKTYGKLRQQLFHSYPLIGSDPWALMK